jgi:hypothetical protein
MSVYNQIKISVTASNVAVEVRGSEFTCVLANEDDSPVRDIAPLTWGI